VFVALRRRRFWCESGAVRFPAKLGSGQPLDLQHSISGSQVRTPEGLLGIVTANPLRCSMASVSILVAEASRHQQKSAMASVNG
jgi:hypothetical protein